MHVLDIRGFLDRIIHDHLTAVDRLQERVVQLASHARSLCQALVRPHRNGAGNLP
jgi:hypothetical protein